MRPAIRNLLFFSQTRWNPGAWSTLTPSVNTTNPTYQNGQRLFLPVSTNLCTNPSFEIDSNADGLADSWTNWAAQTAGTIVNTRVAALGLGSYAQRSQYTGVAGDTAGFWGLYSGPTGAGSVSPGDKVELSMLVKGAVSGVTYLNLVIYWRKSDGSGNGAATATITVSSNTTRFILVGLAPANTSQIRYGIETGGVVNGSTIDITIDDVLLSINAIDHGAYFDGSLLNCAWTGSANASTSTRTADTLTYAGVVTINSNGPVALAGQTIYYQQLDLGMYGPIVVTPSAKSNAIATEIAKAYNNPNRLQACLSPNDIVIYLNSQTTALQKVSSQASFPSDPGFISKRNWVREPIRNQSGEIALVWNGTVWQMWAASSGHISYKIASSLFGPWINVSIQTLSGGGANASRSRVHVIGGTYHLLVAAGPTSTSTQFDHYTSTDGVSWTISAANIMPLGSAGQWDAYWFGNMDFWFDGSLYWMIYEAGPTAPANTMLGIASASSLNGPWTKYVGNPVIGTPTTFEAGSPSILIKNGVYYCWMLGNYTSGQLPDDIWLATAPSPTGPWTVNPSPEFVRTTADEGVGCPTGQVADPRVVEYNNVLFMFYNAVTQNPGGVFTGKMAAGYLLP